MSTNSVKWRKATHKFDDTWPNKSTPWLRLNFEMSHEDKGKEEIKKTYIFKNDDNNNGDNCW